MCLLALLALSTGGGVRADEESDWRTLQGLDLAAGAYLLRMVVGGEVVTRKVVHD